MTSQCASRTGPSGIRPFDPGDNTGVHLAEIMEIPASIELLSDPNIWVFDTGASNHFTMSKLGATNIRESGETSRGMTGNAVSNELIDLKLTQYSKSGVRGHTCTLTDVSYNKKFKYNLFSPSRLMSKAASGLPMRFE